MRKDEVETATVDLELGAEVLLAHCRALDVPARAAASPRRVPPRVLPRLVRLPQSEVARILFARVRLLLRDLIGLLSAQPSVVGEARDTKVDIPVGDVGGVALEQLLDQVDLVGNRVSRSRLDVGHPDAEPLDVLEVPARRIARELRARTGSRVVDLVVDVGDVDDELRVVAAQL